MKRLKLSCGYIIEEKKKTVGLVEAYKLLTTKRQHRYTRVERCGNQAVLYWHIIRCPYCNKEIPAYPHYLHKERHARPRKSASELYKWAQMQMILFEDENNTIYFQQPEYYNGEYTCSKCGNNSVYSDEMMQLEIGKNDISVYIMRKVKNIKDIMGIKWISSFDLTTPLPLFEKIVFDFDSGDILLQLIAQNKVINSININDIKNLNDISIWTEHILKNFIIKRNLKNLFQQFHKEPIPFSTNELDLEKFVLMSKFLNFPRKFYEHAPLLEDSCKLYESFSYVVDDLRNPQKAMKLLENSSLPNVKSVRRLFVQKPILFFYIKECEELFNILKDLNLFCKLLNSNKTCMIVVMLHYFPGVKGLYKDYCKTKNAISLCKVLKSNAREINNQAIRYSALSPVAKKEEQNRWKTKGIFEKCYNHYFIEHNFPFHTPMPSIPEHIKNRNIDNYSFKWLETKKDYKIAGEKLGNCLSSWQWFNDPVVGVYKSGKIIAAMEIGGEWVMQAYEKRNEVIEKGTSLYSAIRKWCESNSLKFGWEESL